MLKGNIERIEEAANLCGAKLTVSFDLHRFAQWRVEWEHESPVSEDRTKLIRCANRKSAAVELIHKDLVKLGKIKET